MTSFSIGFFQNIALRQFSDAKVFLIVSYAYIEAKYAQFQREILRGLLRHTLFRKTDQVNVRREIF